MRRTLPLFALSFLVLLGPETGTSSTDWAQLSRISTWRRRKTSVFKTPFLLVFGLGLCIRSKKIICFNILRETRVCDLRSCNFLCETKECSFGVVLLSLLISCQQKQSLSGLESSVDACFCNFLSETKEFCLGVVPLSRLRSRQQKPSLSGLELSAEAFVSEISSSMQNSDPSVVVLPRLVSVLKEAPLPEIELRTLFPEF
jgi:hypothetical protein